MCPLRMLIHRGSSNFGVAPTYMCLHFDLGMVQLTPLSNETHKILKKLGKESGVSSQQKFRGNPFPKLK